MSESTGTWRKFLGTCHGLTSRDRRNVRRANWWLLGWMATFVGVAAGLGHVIPVGLWSYLAIGASTALGVYAVLAYIHFIREADELLRKIQLEALGIGFGAALIANFTLSLLERADVYTFDAGDLMLVMVIGYVVGVATGTRRYA